MLILLVVSKLLLLLLLSLSFLHFHSTSFVMSKSKPELKRSDSISNVVVAIAMEAEANPFIEHLNLSMDDEFFPKNTPFVAYRGRHNECHITVVTNGKDHVYETNVDNCGTVPAAMATYLALEKLNGAADLLINAGTCGGFQAMGAAIGDVYFTTASANHDRRIPIPSFDKYGVGRLDSIATATMADALNAKQGVCTTSNSLDRHEIDDFHMKENNASVKDMEAAAIAWSCSLHGTPHFGVKVVTDIVDGDRPTQDEFLENLHSAAQSLQKALPKVIDYVCGKGHDEL